MDAMERMTIGRLARTAGVSGDTIRYYERLGLLIQPKRPASGYRTYDEDHVLRLQFIKRAQGLGFTLEEIGELLRLRLKTSEACRRVQDKTEEKIKVIREKQAQLRHMERQLRTLLRACETRAPMAVCPLLTSLWEPD
jgi:Hg(II)-responsive transcriptional regulator